MRNKQRGFRKVFAAVMALMLVAGYAITPVFQHGDIEAVYGAENGGVFAETVGSPGGMQGDEHVTVGFQIENRRNENITVQNMKLAIDGGGITVEENTGSMSIPSGGKQTVSFSVQVTKRATTGERTLRFTANLKDAGGSSLTNQDKLEESATFTVYEKMATDGVDTKTVAAVEISHSIQPAGGFVQGNDNKLKVEFYNYGNTTIKNAVVSLTLPEGLSIYNGSNQAQLGYVSVGTKKTAEFPITVKDGMESKNYPIEVQVLGLNFMNGDVVAKKTFYIPVEGTGSVSSDNISITNVNIPEEMQAGQTFDLNFTVQNTGSTNLKNIKVTVDPGEGIINKSKNIFIDNIPKGSSKNYNVKLHTFEGAEEKSYPIKITAEPASTSEEKAASVMQYATVTILSDGTTAKKPQLMVDSYTYGGSMVQAGSDFMLNLSVFNTSGKTLSNVKVSLVNEDGIFVPIKGSNSFFLDKIGAKEHYTKSIRFSTKTDAEQKTTAITVNMTYEDGSGNPLESADTIAIPVTQKTKLVVDDLVPPMETYAGQQGSCEIQFYNMGKTVLNNLRVNCDGDFDVMESNSYFVGNMEAGKSDSYRFNYIPRQAGPMTGTITFTFEDNKGNPQFLEVPFEFEAMEEPVWDEEMPMEEPTGKKVPWSLVIAGAAVVIIAAGIIIFKKRRKKKLHDSLMLEDDFDMSIGDEIGEINQQAQEEKAGGKEPDGK